MKIQIRINLLGYLFTSGNFGDRIYLNFHDFCSFDEMSFVFASYVIGNQNQNSLLVIRQIDNHSPGAVTGGKISP